jgi:ABC-type Mn2+/Zn2+ transport system permease subunit
MAVAGLLGVAAMWGGLTLGYAVPSLPPSSAIVALAVGIYGIAAGAGWWSARLRSRRDPGPRPVTDGPL